MTLTGQTFFIDGDAFKVELYGPVTCLCVSLEEGSILWRFTTEEVIQYMLEKINGTELG